MYYLRTRFSSCEGNGWRVLLVLSLLLLPRSARSGADSLGPLEVGDALKRFHLSPDLVIEAVASEPLVTDPVAIAFDERGRLYVVEYRDYPLGPGEGKPPLSRIKRLEDTDGDGRMDQVTLFADGLSFAQGLLPWNRGLVVTAAPEVLFLKDTDDDGKADVREVLYRGFTPGNPQLRVAHPRLGLDNWIYVTNGLSNGEVTSDSVPGASVPLQGHDFRFHPATRAFEPATGFGQFGNTFDDWGNRFFCSNRNPTMVSILPYAAMVRNPYALIGKGYEDVADFGGDAKVYPIVPTATTAFEHTGTHTAACGVTVHRESPGSRLQWMRLRL
ncbi:MAG: PVC-type heme-binding CxxCH protein [Planctomycetota bacterium]